MSCLYVVLICQAKMGGARVFRLGNLKAIDWSDATAATALLADVKKV